MTRVFEKVSQAIPEVQKSQFKRSKFNMKNLDKFNKNANPEDQTLFIETIEEVLRKIAAEGFDQRRIEAAINYFEFKIYILIM